MLLLAALILVGKTCIVQNNTPSITINENDPVYKIDHSSILIYNSDGALNYLLIASHIEHFSKQGISWFIQPVLTTYDINQKPIWSIKSDRAKLVSNHIISCLYLYGNVEVNTLSMNTLFRKISSNTIRLNLITQDITSSDLVTLYGKTFQSRGLKMQGNLRSKNAMLIGKVKTSYATKKK